MRYGQIVSKALWVQDHELQVDNALLGLAGEVGEILDYYKKERHHPEFARKPVDLRQEIGDVLFYLALLNEKCFGDSLLEVARDNINKLRKRHADRYVDVDLAQLTL